VNLELQSEANFTFSRVTERRILVVLAKFIPLGQLTFQIFNKGK